MIRHSVLVGLLAATVAASAVAQTPPAPSAATKPPATPAPATTPAPAASNDPAQTTATYGDWVLRCVHPEKGPNVCELVQSMMVQGQQQPVAQVAVGYDKGDMRFTLLVPPAISLSHGPTFGVPGATAPHYDLAWRRCLPNGCFADVGVGPDMLKTLRTHTDPMQLSFKDAVERDVNLPLSMRGLVAALDALAKEPH